MTPRKQELFWSHVIKTDSGCWNWSASTRRGYGEFWITTHRRVYAHRASYELARGPIPDGLQVLHDCDNPRCVNPAHLFLGTNADNMADKVAKGRALKGERNGAAKLTAEKVLQIRALHSAGQGTLRALGKAFGVSSRTISLIVQRKKWQHLQPGAAT